MSFELSPVSSPPPQPAPAADPVAASDAADGSGLGLTPRKPRVAISYCTGCQWLFRATWFAQELLSTFKEEIGEVALVPDRSLPGGVFEIWLDSTLLFSRKRDSGFPDIKDVKKAVRDVIAPSRALGHSDRNERKSFSASKKSTSSTSQPTASSAAAASSSSEQSGGSSSPSASAGGQPGHSHQNASAIAAGVGAPTPPSGTSNICEGPSCPL